MGMLYHLTITGLFNNFLLIYFADNKIPGSVWKKQKTAPAKVR